MSGKSIVATSNRDSEILLTCQIGVWPPSFVASLAFVFIVEVFVWTARYACPTTFYTVTLDFLSGAILWCARFEWELKVKKSILVSLYCDAVTG